MTNFANKTINKNMINHILPIDIPSLILKLSNNKMICSSEKVKELGMDFLSDCKVSSKNSKINSISSKNKHLIDYSWNKSSQPSKHKTNI